MTAPTLDVAVPDVEAVAPRRVQFGNHKRAVHAADDTLAALCGRGSAQVEVVEVDADVTCKWCIRRIDDRTVYDWLDEVAVERALHGEKVGRRLTHAERVAVARRLAARGDGAGALSNLIGVNGPTSRAIFREALAS